MPDSCPNEPPSSRQLSAWLQGKLFERRIVLITGQLDDAVAAEASAQLVTLAATREEPIDIHVDSPDGTIAAAFVLIDALDVLRAPVRAHCRGQIGGPVIGVVAAARQRSAAPHTRFRLGQPTAQRNRDDTASRTHRSTPTFSLTDSMSSAGCSGCSARRRTENARHEFTHLRRGEFRDPG